MSSLFDMPQYTESDLERMWHTSLKDWLSFTMNETQKEIARRLERNEKPESIAETMGIPLSHVVLLKK